MITVLCWYWTQSHARTKFTPFHVEIWADMVRRHLTLPHRIACVTRELVSIPGVEIITPPRDFETVQLPTWNNTRPQCLRRLAMFRPDAADIFGERIVCMDLDCVIGGSLDELFCGGEDFRITKGTAPGRPYNGSMLMLRAGSRPQVHTEFTPQRAAEAGQMFVGSDQAWLAYILGANEKVWDGDDGVAFADTWDADPRRIRFYTGARKPWKDSDPWAVQHYRKQRDGRCLLLGYGPSLWSDVDRAINQPFDAVIASPEAAEHWPGELLAVASTNEEAGRLAYMHGFDDVTWCGLEMPEEAEAA